ncbi:MAG: hypothetical protein AAGF11_31965 [Myxococcota bacterium]
MKGLTSRRLPTAAAAFAVLTAGCGALDRFEDGGATVFVFATHHATPEDGVFPNRGDDALPREFDSTDGWTVTLFEAYVTVAAVTLVACSGTEYELNMFWGPCPEDFKDQDLATLTVAGTRVGDGDYCGLRVTYDAYQMPVIDQEAEETRHETPDNPMVEGATIYMRGAAQMGDAERIDFDLTSSETVVVDLDLSEIEGDNAPFNVAHREDFPKELLISKTYDRFFDGVDFNTLDPAAVEGQFARILAEQTRVSEGTNVTLDEDEMAPSMDDETGS